MSCVYQADSNVKDLISEYQQYQEATNDEDNEDDEEQEEMIEEPVED